MAIDITLNQIKRPLLDGLIKHWTKLSHHKTSYQVFKVCRIWPFKLKVMEDKIDHLIGLSHHHNHEEEERWRGTLLIKIKC
jgi:hypothetical protein